MATKKKSSTPPTSKPPKHNDDDYVFSEDALNLATRRFPPGYNRIVAGQPDAEVLKNEELELLKKVVPEILGETEMAWVYHFYTFHNESLSSIAKILKAMSGNKYSLSKLNTLLTQAQGRVKVLFSEYAAKIQKQERLEKAKKRHGSIQ